MPPGLRCIPTHLRGAAIARHGRPGAPDEHVRQGVVEAEVGVGHEVEGDGDLQRQWERWEAAVLGREVEGDRTCTGSLHQRCAGSPYGTNGLGVCRASLPGQPRHGQQQGPNQHQLQAAYCTPLNAQLSPCPPLAWFSLWAGKVYDAPSSR